MAVNKLQRNGENFVREINLIIEEIKYNTHGKVKLTYSKVTSQIPKWNGWSRLKEELINFFGREEDE